MQVQKNRKRCCRSLSATTANEISDKKKALWVTGGGATEALQRSLCQLIVREKRECESSIFLYYIFLSDLILHLMTVMCGWTEMAVVAVLKTWQHFVSTCMSCTHYSELVPSENLKKDLHHLVEKSLIWVQRLPTMQSAGCCSCWLSLWLISMVNILQTSQVEFIMELL